MYLVGETSALYWGKRLDEISHKGPHQRQSTTRDSSSLVRDLDRDVLVTLSDDDLDRWKALALGAMSLDDGAERVLQDLEKDVVLRTSSSEKL